jgi:hypothetical protein
LSHSTSPLFVIYFFEIGSHELFAWAGFKLWSSWSVSWVPRITDMSHPRPAQINAWSINYGFLGRSQRCPQEGKTTLRGKNNWIMTLAISECRKDRIWIIIVTLADYYNSNNKTSSVIMK